MEKTLDINGIKGILHFSQSPSKKYIVACHGLYSSKNSRKYIELGERFSKKEYHVLRFDFRGCGESTGSFRKSTLTNRLTDLTEVLYYLRNHQPHSKIGLFGSSLGGLVSVLLSSVGDWPEIQALVIWSTPSDLSGNHELPVDHQQDLKKYNVIQSSRRLPPTLIIHGSNDRLVPVSQAYRLFYSASFPKKIRVYDTDHRFSSPKEREKAYLLSLMWFNTYI